MFVDLVKLATGDLKLILMDAGRERLRDEPTVPIHELIEDHLCNGWHLVRPEEIGALTACELILADTGTRDANEGLIGVERVYWHERYQVENEIEVLLAKGELVLEGVACELRTGA